ncbi:UNVERIFIED_ORG: hypothetical protein J2W82_001858 [Pseudomonas mohnii]|jgi:hypothetical protein|nr:hypothetical protein [Pseudomonas mohnii]
MKIDDPMRPPVGASLLAKDVNADADRLEKTVA